MAFVLFRKPNTPYNFDLRGTTTSFASGAMVGHDFCFVFGWNVAVNLKKDLESNAEGKWKVKHSFSHLLLC